MKTASGAYSFAKQADPSGDTYFFVSSNPSGGNTSGMIFQDGATAKWNIGKNPSDQFHIADSANGGADTLNCVTGGNCTFGEATTSIDSFKGVFASSNGFTISTLPTCNSTYKGAHAYVTNGVANPTFLSAVSSSGSTFAPVWCNGSAWVYGG